MYSDVSTNADPDQSWADVCRRIANAISDRQKWLAVYEYGAWREWPEDVQLRFLEQYPTVPADMPNHGLN